MKKIGYMDGTDPLLLSKLAAAGVETAPLGNGYDNAGRYIGYLNPADGIDAVVGYFHKFLPLNDSNVCAADLLKPCQIHNIPVYIIVAQEDRANAQKIMGDCGSSVKYVDPGEVAAELLKVVK
jgi:hypothetical protein